MLVFLYLSGIISFLIIAGLFALEGRKLKKKNYPKDKIYDYMVSRMFVKLAAAAIVSIVIVFVVPTVIWNVSEKEITYEDKTEKTELLFPFQDNDKFYASLSRGKYQVVVSSVEDKISFDKNKTQVIAIKFNEQPKYEKIGHYKKVRIKKDGFILNAANDVFCSSIPESTAKASDSKSVLNFDKGWKETLVEYDTKLYLPAGSIKE